MQAEYEIVAMLLDAGASVEATGSSGKNLLDSFKRRGLSRYPEVDRVIFLLSKQGCGEEVFAGSLFGERPYAERLKEQVEKSKTEIKGD